MSEGSKIHSPNPGQPSPGAATVRPNPTAATPTPTPIEETDAQRIWERRQAARGAAMTGAITWRSIFLGLALVTLMALFTPYNDYILQNTPFIGNHFPIGVITLVLSLVLVLNPLLRLARRRPLMTGELVVILSMLLVAAAAPSSGLNRYLESRLMGIVYHSQSYPWWRELLAALPSWLVPTKDNSSRLLEGYMVGLDRSRGETVPILPFLVPALAWGVMVAATYGIAMYLAAIFRKQWVVHERLSYPLATVPLELLAAPEEGRYFNRLWRNPLLWAGAALPVLVYAAAGLHAKVPSIPYIKLEYDFTSAFTEAPWDQLPIYLQHNNVYLSIVGLCFFVPADVALSLWLFLVLNGLMRVFMARHGIDIGPTEPVRGMGIYLAYFLGLLWLARRHLWRVLVGAWHGTPREDGEYASYRGMVIGFLLCLGVAWIWLIAVGIHPAAGIVLLGLGIMLLTLMSRILVETGIFFLGTSFQISQFMQAMIGPRILGASSYFMSSLTGSIFYGDLRETLMPYATNSLRLGADLRSPARPKLLRWMFAALFLSVIVSAAANHYMSYSSGRVRMNDGYASYTAPVDIMQDAYRYGHSGGAGQRGALATWGNFGLGVVMVVITMVGRSMWAAWPFHPIGLVLMSRWPLSVLWFSILIGWGIKETLLRYGGAKLFRRSRPFFIGLIVGEILAAGVWMLVGFATHGEWSYRLLPG